LCRARVAVRLQAAQRQARIGDSRATLGELLCWSRRVRAGPSSSPSSVDLAFEIDRQERRFGAWASNAARFALTPLMIEAGARDRCVRASVCSAGSASSCAWPSVADHAAARPARVADHEAAVVAGGSFEVRVAGARDPHRRWRSRAYALFANAHRARDHAARRAAKIEAKRVVLAAVIDGSQAIIFGIEATYGEIKLLQRLGREDLARDRR
jgi:hypothetical protein